MQKKIEFLLCYMSYLASNLMFSSKNYVKKKYKSIENCHVKNAVLGKDFNLGTTNSFFHAFTLVANYHQL